MTNLVPKTLTTALMLSTLASGAVAKDWIESFDLRNTGIDLEPVAVAATPEGYTGTTTSSRVFDMTIAGAAEQGKRINGMTIGAGTQIAVKESNIGVWHYPFTWAQIGNGDRRTLQLSGQFNVPFSSVSWLHNDPVAECNANMAEKIDDGMTKEQVLASEWNVAVDAVFSAEMSVARRLGVEPAAQTQINHMDYASDYYIYRVNVTCQSAPFLGDTILPPSDTTTQDRPQMTLGTVRPPREPSRPNPSNVRPPRQDPRPARLEIRPSR